jgi:glucose-1-phosphatase
VSNTKYSVIVSDLGNVILPFSYDPAISKLEQVEKGLGEKFFSYLRSNYELHRKNERGDISSEEFIGTMLSALGNKVTVAEFCSIYSEIFTVNQPLVSVLAELKKNYTLVLLSNTNKIHRDHGWGSYPFLSYFEKMILSYEVHAVKPEDGIYKAVEEFTQKPPQEHLFIDDIAGYAQAAKNRGWDAVQYLNFGQLQQDLAKRGVL